MSRITSKERTQAMRILDLENDLKQASTRFENAQEDALLKIRKLENDLKDSQTANQALSHFKHEVQSKWNEWLSADKGEVSSHDDGSLIVTMRRAACIKFHPTTFQKLLNLMPPEYSPY